MHSAEAGLISSEEKGAAGRGERTRSSPLPGAGSERSVSNGSAGDAMAFAEGRCKGVSLGAEVGIEAGPA